MSCFITIYQETKLINRNYSLFVTMTRSKKHGTREHVLMTHTSRRIDVILSFDMIDISEGEVSGDEEEYPETPEDNFVDSHIAHGGPHTVHGHYISTARKTTFSAIIVRSTTRREVPCTNGIGDLCTDAEAKEVGRWVRGGIRVVNS